MGKTAGASVVWAKYLVFGVLWGVMLIPAMKANGQTVIRLWDGAAPLAQGDGAEDVPTLTAFLPGTNATGTAVIVAPGGGYGHLSAKEAEIGPWLAARGVAAFVLKYRLGPKYHYPVEQGDAKRAVRLVRARAGSFGVKADHVGMLGFSAGGHLAATTGTTFDAGVAGSADVVERQSSRPDFLVLCYPVITLEDPQAHVGSRKNLLGEHPEAELVDRLSAQKQVTAGTPPTFLYATSDDPVVPVMNSVMFYEALVRNKVSAEMHLYAHGPHGTGLAEGYPELKSWTELLMSWMRAMGWMGA